MAGAGSEKVEKKKAPAGPQVYVVQMKVGNASRRAVAGAEAVSVGATWEDVATVTVPPRSKAVTVVKAALAAAEAAGQQVKLPSKFRLLGAEAAREVSVGTRQPPAELVIG